MKITVTTSDKYHHLLKIFVYLFNKNWSSAQEVEIVGYNKPYFELPNNFTFYSLGKQSNTNKDFSNDLRKYFEKQDEWFIWVMEDSWIKSVDFVELSILKYLIFHVPNLGKINLSRATQIQDHRLYDTIDDYRILENTQTSLYRLSTAPSIWNREFLLQYLKPNLNPWDFETQESINDGWRILGPEEEAIKYNEGVCKRDLYDYDLNGIKEEQINEMKQLGIL
jgi:hypothetical protein